MNTVYNTIGLNYADLRQEDRRIATAIEAALGDAESVLNVGAGAGSYEPVGKRITAVEPSSRMIAQRPISEATVIQGEAEHLPFEDNSFDASMAVLTIHHWADKDRGVSEMRRVTKGPLVFLTHDPSFRDLWLFDYFPEIPKFDEGKMPPLGAFQEWLGDVEIQTIPIPHDCTDGFMAAYWRRPSAYLDKRVRDAISLFWAMGDVSVNLERLEKDLADGEWERRHGHVLNKDNLDCGYRLVVADAV